MKITLRSKPVKDGNRSLFLEYYDKGKRTYEFLRLYIIPETDAKAKKENENALKTAQAIKAERTLHPETIPTGIAKEREKAITESGAESRMTLLEWIDEYTKMLIACGNYSKACISQTATVKDAVVQYLASMHKKDIKLSKIGVAFVRGYLAFLGDGYIQKHWKKEAKPISISTKKVYQTKFVTILNKAVREGKIKANPFYQLDRSEMYHAPKTMREYLTVDEVKRFMEVETDGKETQRAFAFACFTGLRISDIRALKWSDIKNPDTAPTIVLNQSKTGDIVRIPLGKMALSLLPEEHTDSHIFHLPTATAVHTSCRWIAERAGIKKNVSFHTARHTFATLTLAACENLELVCKLLGHKSVKTTQRYADVLLDRKVEAVSRMANLF